MILLKKTWSQFSDIIDEGVVFIEQTSGSDYELYAEDSMIMYHCLVTETADKTDYTTNYQSKKSTVLKRIDDEGRVFQRAESKPTTMTTYFAGAGDSSTEIGGGDALVFDFSNTDNDVSSPPSGYKQKRVCVTFIDTVRLKEGTLYWENAPFGSHVDLCLGVPNNGYYQKNDGTLAQNTTGDVLAIAKFVKRTPMMGSCPMGDEMNTEAASNDIPAGTVFGFLVTVPDVTGYSDCHGGIVMELYRERTVILE